MMHAIKGAIACERRTQLPRGAPETEASCGIITFWLELALHTLLAWLRLAFVSVRCTPRRPHAQPFHVTAVNYLTQIHHVCAGVLSSLAASNSSLIVAGIHHRQAGRQSISRRAYSGERPPLADDT